MQSLRYGDDLGFALGVGEMSSSMLLQLVEDGIVRATPQIIKQMKHGILFSRGFAGVISNPFDMYDLIDSLINVSNAAKGSKEWRDSIAGSVFAGGSILSSIGFTAINKPGAGTVVGLGIIIGQSIYSGASMVKEYERYDLTFDENFRLFWHTFAMQLPPEDVQYIEARKNIINEIAKNVWKSLKKSGATAYATGLGEISFKDPVRYNLPSNHPIRPYGQDMNSFPVPAVDLSEIRIKPRTPVLHSSNATILMDLSSIKGNNYRDFLSRVLPDSPSPNAKMFCLPASFGETYERDHTFSNQHSIYRSSNDITSYCENAMAIRNEQANQKKMIYDLNLVKEGIVVGSDEYENQFIISESFDFSSNTSKPFLSRAKVLGGENTKNVFSVTNKMFKGRIIGGKNSSNIVDISNIRNGYSVHLNGSQISRREYVRDYMFSRSLVNEQRDNLHISGIDNLVISTNVTIEGSDGNYTFYIKPNVGHSRINVLAEKGYLVFPETYVLSSCNFTYNLERNTLSLQMSQSFTLDVENYLVRQDEDYAYRFELADKGGAFEPLINLNSSNPINAFYLRTRTDLLYNDVPEWYRNMTQGREVYGVVDLLNHPITVEQPHMIFGTSKSDIISLTRKTWYAEGKEGSDAYNMVLSNGRNSATTEVNNYAEDIAFDLLYMPVNSIQVSRDNSHLHLYAANLTQSVKVKDYFLGDNYQHLAVINDNKDTFIPLEGPSKDISLVPFYHPTNNQHIFSLAAEKVANNSEVIVDAKLDDIRFYRDGNDLLLMDDKPLMVKLENFYDKHGNLTLNFWHNNHKDKLSSEQLFELAKLAINYQDEIKSTYYDNVKEYVVPASNTTIHHNQKFMNGSLTTVEPSTKRIGVLVLQDPSNIEVSMSNNDLVFFVGQSNATFTIKNWNDTDHRISVLKFNQEIEVTGLDKFDLSQVSEIQPLVNKAVLSSIATQQLEKLDSNVVNSIKYLLAVRGIENGIDTHKYLGFDSAVEEGQFISAYHSRYSAEKLNQFLSHEQGVKALVWLIVKVHTGLLLENHNIDRQSLLNDLNECFNAVANKRAINEIVGKLELEVEDIDTVVPNVESFIGRNKGVLDKIANSLRGNATNIDIEEDNHQRKRRDESEVKGYEDSNLLFHAQNNANSSLKGQQVTSGGNKLSSTNSGSRPSSWINDFVGWVKNSIAGFLAPSTEQVSSNIVQPEISNAFVDGFLILSDVGIRKFTGNKYKQPKHDSLLSPKELIEQRMDHTAINAINSFGKVYDFQNATSKVYDKPMTCLSSISLEKAVINMDSKKGIL